MKDIEDATRRQYEVLAEALRVARLGPFQRSPVLRDLLLFLARIGPSPSEYEIAETVFGRGNDFNPATDGIVRVSVRRLRKRLNDIYVKSPQRRVLSIHYGYRLVLKASSTGSPSRNSSRSAVLHRIATLEQELAALREIIAADLPPDSGRTGPVAAAGKHSRTGFDMEHASVLGNIRAPQLEVNRQC